MSQRDVWAPNAFLCISSTPKSPPNSRFSTKIKNKKWLLVDFPRKLDLLEHFEDGLIICSICQLVVNHEIFLHWFWQKLERKALVVIVVQNVHFTPSHEGSQWSPCCIGTNSSFLQSRSTHVFSAHISQRLTFTPQKAPNHTGYLACASWHGVEWTYVAA